MKDIKFRAWDKNNKRYIYDIQNMTLEKDGYTLGSMLALAIECFDIEQYVGIKDANDKEIYEGDLVKVNEDCSPAIVEFNIDDVWSCGCCNYSFDGTGFVAKNKYELVSLKRCVVSGNIHEGINK